MQWCAGKPKFGGGDVVGGKVVQTEVCLFVCLFNVGRLGMHGPQPRPKKGIPRRSAGPAWQCDALPCLRAPGKKLEHRKDRKKSVPGYPAVSLTSTCIAGGVQGLPRPCPRGTR